MIAEDAPERRRVKFRPEEYRHLVEVILVQLDESCFKRLVLVLVLRRQPLVIIHSAQLVHNRAQATL